MPLLLIMSILIIEAGFFYIKQTQLQNAADAIALAGVTDKDEVKQIIKLNRTVDYVEENLQDPDLTDGVTLKEDVKPIFHKMFGSGTITTITVYAKAENGKLVLR